MEAEPFTRATGDPMLTPPMVNCTDPVGVPAVTAVDSEAVNLVAVPTWMPPVEGVRPKVVAALAMLMVSVAEVEGLKLTESPE